MCSKRWISELRHRIGGFALVLALAIGLPAGEPLADARAMDFTLQSAAGPVALSDLRGKVVLLFFGYTSCPDVCPMSLAKINACFSSLSAEEVERVVALFVTLDPERDSAERMREYAAYFHPGIIGLTGTQSDIDAVTAQYDVRFERKSMPDSALGYSISHPTQVFILDAGGTLVGRLPHDANVTELRDRVRALIRAAE